jgi:hypothetical protein
MHMLGSWKPLEVHGCDIHGHLHLNVMWPSMSMDILYPYALFLFGRSGDIERLGVPLQACFLEILNGIGTERILPLLASTQIAPFDRDAYRPAKVRIPAQIELTSRILKGHDATYGRNTLPLLRNLELSYVLFGILVCRYSDKPRGHQNRGTHNLLHAFFTGVNKMR